MAAGPRRRRHLHASRPVPCRPATTRPRSRSTRAGTRTTARAACRTAPTSRSPCPRPATPMTFSYDPTTPRPHGRERRHRPPQPGSVTIAGSLQSELGCPGDWQPDCAGTHLAFDADRRRLAGDLRRPGGQLGVQGGAQRQLGRELRRRTRPATAPNIGLTLAAPTAVKFYYDHATHWVTTTATRDRHRAGQLPERARLPRRLAARTACARGCRTRTATASTPSRRGPSRRAATRRRSRSTRAGTRTTARAASRAAPTSPSPCPPPCTEIFFSFDAVTHVLTVSDDGRAAAATCARRRRTGVARTPSPGDVDASGGRQASRCTTRPTAASARRPRASTGGEAVPLDARSGRPVRPSQGEVPAPRELHGVQAARGPARRGAPRRCSGQLAVSATAPTAGRSTPRRCRSPACSTTCTPTTAPLGVDLVGRRARRCGCGRPTAQVGARCTSSPTPTAAHGRPSSPMTRDDATGVWSVTGDAGWKGKFYLYEVEVYVPRDRRGRDEPRDRPVLAQPRRRTASAARSSTSPTRRSKPAGWDGAAKPPLAAPEDIVALRAARPRLQRHRPDACRSRCAAPSWPSPCRRRTACGTCGAGRGRADPRPPAARLRLRHRRRGQEPAGSSRPATSAALPARLDRAAGRASSAVARPGRLQLGLRPVALHRARRQLRDRPRRRGAHPSSSARWCRRSTGTGLRVVMDVVYNHTNAAGPERQARCSTGSCPATTTA